MKRGGAWRESVLCACRDEVGTSRAVATQKSAVESVNRGRNTVNQVILGR